MADLDGGHPLRRARKLRKLTMEQLARLAEVAPRTVSNIERRRCAPRMEVQRKILNALGIPFENRRFIFEGALARRRGP